MDGTGAVVARGGGEAEEALGIHGAVVQVHRSVVARGEARRVGGVPDAVSFERGGHARFRAALAKSGAVDPALASPRRLAKGMAIRTSIQID